MWRISIPPERLPPFVWDNDPMHQVNPDLFVDWTLFPEDYEKEKELREVRNRMVMEK